MKKLFSFLMLIGILAAGCSQEEYGYTTNMGDDANTPSFTFVEGTYLTPTIGSDGGALVYNFATNSAWSATSSEEWISITPASGDATATCFTISAPKNLTGHARTTTIKVAYGNGKSLEILLSQAAELCAVNEIAYRTTDGEIFTPATIEGFGAEFIDNTYENSYGKLCFTGEVKSIPAEAFKGCTTLKLIILPEQLTTIGDSAFEGCTELQEIRFNKAVTTIGKMTFSECEALSAIVLGENITTIGEGAFNKCSQLESIAIPDGVSHIGNYTFYSCASLVAV
ncbi:MAG: leucine-rich repeat protein, partial [Alistipes sp.]|nr:leucine-rich repeat protein [Alistipes sp.]